VSWSTLATASIDHVRAWAERESWCQAMAACPQDPEWHAEGDVWTHTQLVLRELPRLAEWVAFSQHERTVLTFAALFHDAGKATTTAPDPLTGRLRSPKHALKGEQLARRVLRELGCDLATRERVAMLVRFHGRPAFLLEKADPAREVVRLSWLLDHRLLVALALADTRGRTTGVGRAEDTIHLWQMVAEEHGCFGRPYAFANDAARVRYFHDEAPALHYVPHEAYACTVTMTSGLPGAGKDTWLAAHRPGLPVVSLDELRVELDVAATDAQGAVVQLARERCREHLRARRSFAFNATNLTRAMRRRWVDLCCDYGARVEIAYVEPAWDVILRQNKARASAVPDKVLAALAAKCEPPTWGEAHEVSVFDGARTVDLLGRESSPHAMQ